MRTIRWIAVPLAVSIALGEVAEAVTVFVVSPPTTTSEDPLSVGDSTAFSFASADLPSGAFRAALTAEYEQTGSTTAGIRTFPNALRFTNPGPGPVLVHPGDIRARVTSSYVLSYVSGSGLPSGASTARCSMTLAGKKGGTTNAVSALHIVSSTFDSDGDVVGSASNFTPTPGVGTVTVLDTSLDHLDVVLALPGYSLAAGETLDLSFSVQVVGASTVGVGSADCTGQLHVLLDPGVTLTHDAGVPLPWVGPATVVPSGGPWLGLVLAAALLMGGRLRPAATSASGRGA